MPYDEVEMNLQCGPKTEPDWDEDGHIQDQGPVPFGGCDVRHWIVLIQCEDLHERIY